VDLAGYRRASQAIWEAMAPGWDERKAWFEQAARPVTERLLERLRPVRRRQSSSSPPAPGSWGSLRRPLSGAKDGSS
jgi:hypothetical protein